MGTAAAFFANFVETVQAGGFAAAALQQRGIKRASVAPLA